MNINGQLCNDPKGPVVFYSATAATGDLKPCPFCGSDEELELENTWTASYSVRCECGCAMDGVHAGLLGFAGDNVEHDEAAHEAAARDAVARWNNRA